MNSEVEYNIRNNVPWNKLPSSVKKSLGNSQKEYEKEIVTFSINNQLRFRANLVFHVRKDEQRYYEELLTYSRTSLLLYPYHLSDIIVKGLRVTPFQYYTRVLETIMEGERSYDSLPNFTAADCLRLLGIGRNEYIDIMNQCRSGRKLFRRKNVKDLLPMKPIDIHIEPWWIVETGYIVEEDVKLVSQAEKELIDRIIDYGKQRAGDLDSNLVHSLYKKGLIYLEVPIEDTDHIVVPPLEGFVMNRVLGDYFETLLYKIFVSIDEHTSVGELASVLQIDLQAVKQAVSLYCRLGFARKKVPESEQWHPTWNPAQSKIVLSPSTEIIPSFSKVYSDLGSPLDDDVENNANKKTRIAFLFDSTLTAFLMMGNLSPGLKSHAVTMFEVGKLTDESMESFLCELEKVSTARDDSEGEARRYFEHALVLRSTVLRLRHRGLDLVRCESLQSLDRETCTRLLNKNYSLLVSMAPLSGEVTPITSLNPPHLGPPCPIAHTLWFKLFLYHITRSGPPSIFIARGTRLRKLPGLLRACDKALVTSWGHDPTVIATSSLLFTLNDALCYAPVLAQAYGTNKGADTHLIPFPFPENPEEENGRGLWRKHPSVVRLEREIGLNESCGYLTMVEIPHSLPPDTPPPIMRPKERLRLPLRDASELHCLETPATPSSVEAWIKTMSGDGDSRVKAYPGSPMKEEVDPSNGLTSQECAHLLEQEIDGLADSNHSSPASRGSEGKEEVPCRLPLRVKLTPAPSPANLSDWSLLDCTYGIPLFDAELNEIICRSVVERLSQKESLDNLTTYNSNLSTRLSEFIETVQGWGEESSGIDSPFTAAQDNSWPLLSVTFLNGQLSPWDGKLLEAVLSEGVRRSSSASNRSVLPIFKSAIKHKNKVCLRDSRGEYTYLGMAKSSRQLAGEITELVSSERQERVAVFCPCSGFSVLAQWAAWMSGQIVVPLEVGYPWELVKRVVKDSGCKVVLTTAEHGEQLRETVKNTQASVLIMETGLLDRARPSANEDTIPEGDLSEDAYGLEEDFYHGKDALLLYTAGTSGPHKGVPLSFSNLDSQMKSVVGPWNLTSADCVLNLRPLTTTDGITSGLLAPFSLGASVVLLEDLIVEEIWAEILGVQGKIERMNILFGDARIFRSLIEEYNKIKVRRKWNEKMEEYVKGICIQKVRLMLSTSSPLPKSILEKWETYTGHEVLEVYSLTEGGIVSSPRPSTSKHTSTVGFPVPGIKMKILSDDGAVVAEGDSSGTKVLSIWENRPVAGALWIKGDSIAKRYWTEIEDNSSWTADGWFKTGDIVSYSKGQYNILGRQLCDIVKTKAYRVSLLQIEAAILDIPEVQDVAAFSFIQNNKSMIAAAICRKPGEVLDFEKVKTGLHLRFPEYAIPNIIIDVSKIPRNHKGMIVRHEIQSYFLDEFQKANGIRKKGED